MSHGTTFDITIRLTAPIPCFADDKACGAAVASSPIAHAPGEALLFSARTDHRSLFRKDDPTSEIFWKNVPIGPVDD